MSAREFVELFRGAEGWDIFVYFVAGPGISSVIEYD